MIVTKENGTFISNTLVSRPDTKAQIEHLCQLYSAKNFEYGYLEHGLVLYSKDEKEVSYFSEPYIELYKGVIKSDGKTLYPVEMCTTKAKNTLILIKQILKLEANYNFALKKFFANKNVHHLGILTERSFDIDRVIKKLTYLLDNEEVGLEILEDAYLDFYLFLNLLKLCDIKTQVIQTDIAECLSPNEAEENTKILSLAKKYIQK